MTLKLDWWLDDLMARIPRAQKQAHEAAVDGLTYFINPLNGTDRDDSGRTIPFGTGPHNYRAFQMWGQLIPNARRILEIGFNVGHGAAALLSVFPKASLVSIDIRESSEVRHAADVISEKYPKRHTLIIGDSSKAHAITTGPFDAAFIDGAHDLPAIIADIQACRKLGVRNFLMDDVAPQYGETLEAIRHTGLKMIAIVGANMAICEDPEA